MAAETHGEEDRYLVKVGGSFDANSHMSVRQVVNEAIDKGFVHLIFDLSECIYMDSSAIGMMIDLHRKLSPKGGSVGLLRPTEPVLRIIKLTNTDSVVAIYDSEDEITDGTN